MSGAYCYSSSLWRFHSASSHYSNQSQTGVTTIDPPAPPKSILAMAILIARMVQSLVQVCFVQTNTMDDRLSLEITNFIERTGAQMWFVRSCWTAAT